MVSLAQDTGCDSLSFAPLRPVLGPHHERGLSQDEESNLLPILRQIHDRATALELSTNVPEAIARLRIGEDVWQSVPCYLGWVSMRIRANGDVVACGTCREPLGNVRTASLSEIWNGAGYQRFRYIARNRDEFVRANPSCECGYCSYVLTNARLHRYLKWMPTSRLAL
jgi:radical SAM protein with 4Fe4S-binding SPASM domain